MMFMLRLSLMLVVFVDIMGQGLILPIINTLLIDPSSSFLHPGTTHGAREVLYGLLTGVFYIFWFFGAAYISKLSDYVGRKRGILVCLLGAMAGYALTVIAIEASNYYLLLLARAISGFTAGNQPIAQAALVDISRTDEERTRNMGKVVAASALGLVAGPLIAGLLSDSSVVGRYATLELPFICAAVLVSFTLALVLIFYHDTRKDRRKIDFGLNEVFINLWRIRERPTIIKISAVFFFFELGLNSFFIYMDDYMIEQFRFGTFQNSILMAVFGLAMAFSSGVLAGPLSARFRKIPTVTIAVVVMAVSLTIYTFNGSSALSYALVVPIVVGFGIGCRVDRGLPWLQAEVCFLRLPPGFPAVPLYLSHTFGCSPAPLRTVLALFTHTAPHEHTSRLSEKVYLDTRTRQWEFLKKEIKLFPIHTPAFSPSVQPLEQETLNLVGKTTDAF